MAANFKIGIYRNNGSLYLKLSGDFDGTSAHELLNVLKNYSRHPSSIFIDTDLLICVNSFGREIFRKNIDMIGKLSTKFIFTGENASQFYP